ncbi:MULTISPECIES: glutathione peroxidase [unclassified Niallia]|uniref:glutathione peroxidase n=1 Tax=Niallia TaxID=2837506 RepID=UPI001EDA6A13|nr:MULTISPECIES: glutathione peroxidase [unclassified Niallia]MCM3031441.1 glutathione peroxidase [Niallia sp. MER 6]MDL0437085.1 glutathione peroxidase [Niallia sp. SS-2023]UPO86352.1 glutathione peroxidase [Niallia sp. Man26]
MTVYDFEVKKINGEEVSLNDYKGKVLVIVNTASKCGFTPQFKELQSIFEEYNDKGFAVLGFPCNQFMNQEPGAEDEILEFCELNYGVTFPMFAKVEVNGKNADPLYKHLSNEAPGAMGLKAIKWNFTKFLVDRSGKVVKRYSPNASPYEMKEDIEKLL